MGASAQPQTYQLPPGKYEQAIEFNRRIDTLHFVSALWMLAVLYAMVRWGVGRRFGQRGVAIVSGCLAIVSLASLPFGVVRHYLGLHYGLSIEPWLSWMWDWTKGEAISLLVSVPAVLGLFWLVRRSPGRWWLWAWLASIPVMVAATYAVPLVIDPLFNSFAPLSVRHPELLAPIEAVANAAGQPVPPERIFEMAASEKTRTLNAYMTGFGATKRIVIWDTTIAKLSAPQIQTVFAHELGHYALHHIPMGIAMGAAGMLLAFWGGDRLLRRLGGRLDDYAVLPLALLLANLAMFISEPIVNTISRAQEHQADAYELRIMRGLTPHAGANSARVDQIMAEVSLDDPDPNPFIELWLYDHPATNERMAFAQSFDK